MPSRPTTIRAAALRAIRTSALCTLPFAVLPLLPVTHDVVSPEHGAAVQLSAASTAARDARQAERALSRCKKLPAGTLPGGVVLDWSDERGTVYSEEPEDVGMAFDLAVGAIEIPPASLLDGWTLCR